MPQSKSFHPLGKDCCWNNLAHCAAFCYNKERKVVLRKGSLNPYECSTAQTPRGYQLHLAEKGYTGILACVHRTQEEMRRELYTVVDQGGTVVDVAVENSLYGEIRATLNLCNRYDVDNFIRQAADAPESLLSRMTGGVHLHTLRCPDKDTFARIRAALEQQGLLYRKE